MSDSRKYYYIKLKDNFFDSEEMKILESQKNGVEYQNLYLKLCLLSLKSGGKLVFKDCIPYDIEMLSTITRVGIDTVKTGIELFSRLGLVDIADNDVLFMSDIQTLIGQSSTEADRIRKYRESIKEGVQMYDNRTPELDIRVRDRAKDRVITKEKNIGRFTPPTVEEVASYCRERGNSIDPEDFVNHYEAKGWKIGNTKVASWQACVRTWERKEAKDNPKEKIKICDNCGATLFGSMQMCGKCGSQEYTLK